MILKSCDHHVTAYQLISMRIVLVSLVVHGLLLLSIFDIYFRSPVEHGMSPQYPTHWTPPAKRLVLFVADGLRADAFYSVDGSGKTLAPYLRGVVETRGKCHALACVSGSESSLLTCVYRYSTVRLCVCIPDLASYVAARPHCPLVCRCVGCVPHPCPHRVTTGPCCRHCRAVRGRQCCHSRLAGEPCGVRLCLQPEQAHLVLGEP